MLVSSGNRLMQTLILSRSVFISRKLSFENYWIFITIWVQSRSRSRETTWTTFEFTSRIRTHLFPNLCQMQNSLQFIMCRCRFMFSPVVKPKCSSAITLFSTSHGMHVQTLIVIIRSLITHVILRFVIFYSSSGYTDELAWGAAWLYRATGEQTYLNQALEFARPSDIGWGFNWDDKLIGAQVSAFE